MSDEVEHSPGTPDDRRRRVLLLAEAGRLLLEFNESTEGIVRTLTAAAQSLGGPACYVAVSYGSIIVSLGDEAPQLRTVPELRLNAAVLTRIHEVLRQLREGEIDEATAVARLASAHADAPRHSRGLTAILLGAAACSFAILLGGDAGASGTAGAATALGLVVRQELGRRGASVLSLPLAAGFLGAVAGGAAIRMGWTRTPDVTLIVPALMIVPGPHILTGLIDLVDNRLSMCLSRLGLALGVLAASAVGVMLGARLMLPGGFDTGADAGVELSLWSDMILAGNAGCGFAAVFNTPWKSLGWAVAGGMLGHGLRFVALQSGAGLEVATCLGGLAVGGIAGWMSRRSGAPVSVLAFAGAVTMIPGTSFYRAVGGMVRLARLDETGDVAIATSTLHHLFEGLFTAGGLAVGVILGIRGVNWLANFASQTGMLPSSRS